jgi:hypothetical protein
MDTQHQQFHQQMTQQVKLGENNSKDTNELFNGLSDTVFTKVAHCKSAKDIWDKLQNIYEGDTKVKEAKL